MRHVKKLQKAVTYREVAILMLERSYFCCKVIVHKPSNTSYMKASQTKSICLRLIILNGQKHDMYIFIQEKNCRRLRLLGRLQF